MKNKQKLYSIVLASATLIFAFSILISSVASAAQVATQVMRIGNGSDPAIYGNKVVWTDSGVIHVYDLVLKTDSTVSSSSASNPAIYGNKLVWHDESSGVPRLTVYDIPSGDRSYITKDVDSSSIPAIYGNRIVWSSKSNESYYNYNVYLRDISTSTQTKIVKGDSPDIYDTDITYGYEDEDGRIIAVYNISTNKTINVGSSSQIFSPHIYGNNVIWSNFYTRSGFIQMYDLATKKTTDVTSDNTGNTLPEYANYTYVDAGDDTGTHIDINGDKIVYSKGGNDQFGYAGVYVYDIPSGKSTPVYIYPIGNSETPDIYDNTIVWGFDNSDGIANNDGIYMSDLSATNTLPPVAEFTANVTSGTVPLVVLLSDISTGGLPTSWYWDTGDGSYSNHEMNATHTFTNPGVYNVTLTVANEAGNSKITKQNYITVTPPQPPVADFSTNVTSGTVPLTVLFAAINKGGAISEVEEPTSWYWDFGDGTNSNDSAPVHTFTKPGRYTILLTVGSIIGNNTTIRPGYIVVIDSNAPVANFSSNLTEGYAPLTVQFNDFSQKASSRIWDFNGDGQPDSSDINPVYVYANPGTYTVNLTVSNSNGTDSKAVIVTVLPVPEIYYEPTSSGSGSGSGGGSVGGSSEPQSNIEAKEVSQTFIGNGNSVNFAFSQNATPVTKIGFDSKTTVGKTTTIVEMLKNQSVLVSEPPSDQIYKFINIWVGSGGVVSQDKIENAVVNFKVEKSWIQDKNIDKSSITLNRFNDKKWNALPTNLSGEDDKYLSFAAKTPGFSPFAITGKSTATGVLQPAVDKTQNPKVSETQKNITNGSTAANIDKTSEQRKSPNSSDKGSTKIPGFEITYGTVSFLAVVLYEVSKKGN